MRPLLRWLLAVVAVEGEEEEEEEEEVSPPNPNPWCQCGALRGMAPPCCTRHLFIEGDGNYPWVIVLAPQLNGLWAR